MKIRHKILLQKYYLNVINGILLAPGLMLFTFGLWLLYNRKNIFSVLFSSIKNQLVAYISCVLLGIGSVTTFTSVLGFLGSVMEIKCLLVTCMNFQILVSVTQMAILVLVFLKREEVHSQWNNRIDEVISENMGMSLAEQEPVWNIPNAVQHNTSSHKTTETFLDFHPDSEWETAGISYMARIPFFKLFDGLV